MWDLKLWSSLSESVFAVLDCQHFQINFKISSSFSTNIYIGIALEIQINLGKIIILTILSLPNSRIWNIYIFRFLISYSNGLQFLVYKFYTFLLKLLLSILFFDIINEIVFLIYFPVFIIQWQYIEIQFIFYIDLLSCDLVKLICYFYELFAVFIRFATQTIM